MKVLTTLLSAVPIPFIRARFHIAGAAPTAVQRDAHRRPRSPESWIDEARDRELMFRLFMR